MAAEVQSRLAVSLPSILMTYLTGAATAPANTTLVDVESENNQDLPASAPSTTLANSRKRPSSIHAPHSAISTACPSPTKSFPSVMFSDHENQSSGSPDISREGSFISTNGRYTKRPSRPKTSYSICQPPPKSVARQKIQVRARPLLQLHKHSSSGRPMPAFELLPSAIFSPSLSRAISRAFHTRHGLSPTDLAIVKADSYQQHEASGSEEEESRDVLALICKGRKGDGQTGARAKLVINDGREWEAYALPNGGYEFFTTDEHGLGTTVRWVVKRPRAKRASSANTSDAESLAAAPSPTKKFNFSIISPNSRRHPIIANLTNTTLDINDNYNIPPPLTSSAAPSPQLGSQNESPLLDEAVETTASLRTLITATAVWVALREGWSLGFRYDDSIMRSPSRFSASSSPGRAATDTAEFSKDGLPRRSASLARMFRTSTTLKRQSTASAPADGTFGDNHVSRNSSVHSTEGPTRRRRAESASTVIYRSAWPRPDLQTLRRQTATSTSNFRSGVDAGDDMTEEEEADLKEADFQDSAVPVPTESPKHPPLAAPILPEPSPIMEPEPHPRPATTDAPSNACTKERKRESSGTESFVEVKKGGAQAATQRKKHRVRRVLLCGMA